MGTIIVKKINATNWNDEGGCEVKFFGDIPGSGTAGWSTLVLPTAADVQALKVALERKEK